VRKPKVLMYGWEFPPEISGGLGVACYGIVNELSKLGLPIKLVLPKNIAPSRTLNKNVLINGCEEARVKKYSDYTEWEKYGYNVDVDVSTIDTLIHPYITETAYHQSLITLHENQKKLSRHKRAIYEHVRLTGKYGPNLFSEVFRYAKAASYFALKYPHDVIHAHDWLTGLAAIEARKNSGKPMVFQVHALEFDRSGENINQSIYDIEKHAMVSADMIVAVSHYTKNIITKRYGIAEGKIRVVHNGTYCEGNSGVCKIHNKVSKHPVVLFLGRITHQKGTWHFINVAKKILSKRPDVNFVIAGNGDSLRNMIEMTAELHIGKNVHFTGFLSQKEVDKIYELADVYVMPSVSEPFGLTCLEALMRNIPVVISKQSGVSEVLNHVLKADFWDVDSMAEKVLALLDYKVLRKECLRQTARDLSHLTWENTAKNLISVYNEVIG
jgi:glycosyltransferase involved in cell wall biosynthesis